MLKPDATTEDIKKLCDEAKKYCFYSVCVNSSYVKLAYDQLTGSGTKVTAVAGFPLGAMDSLAKAYEANIACENGAEEIDMVINVGALKEGRDKYVASDISEVKSVCYDHDAILKVILETCLLTDDEIVRVCKLAENAGAEFIKTSTGFASAPNGSSGGATVHDVQLIRRSVSDHIRIKASGGIHTLAQANALIEAGAGRLGCSASVSIMEEYLDYLTR